MTTLERQDVRQALLDAGFERTTNQEPDEPKFYDHGSRGAYTEIWRHKQDRTKITLDWDVKTFKS
jgi:hypothetical protein